MSQPARPNYYTTTDGAQLDLSTMTQFDPYLSALGLVPNSAWPMTGYAPPMPTTMDPYANIQPASSVPAVETFGGGYLSNGAQNSVQDWFSGSRYLMNLMEAGDDLQMPDLNDFDVQL